MKTEADLILTYVFISAAVISVLSFFIVMFIFTYQRKMVRKQLEFDAIEVQYQRDLFNSVMQAKEQEKKRISEELHDDIGSRLNALRIMLKKKDTVDLKEIDEQLILISKRVRGLSNELIPSTLQATGLMRSLRELISGIDRTDALSASCQIDVLETLRFNDEINLSIYRIVQELVNNIIKHASATAVQLSAYQSMNALIIELVDNGTGFLPKRSDLTAKLDNMGLKNIASRSQYINARIQFELVQPKGTKVKISLNLP